MSDITLTLPPIGFGTYALRGRSGADAVTSAIRNGYRLIDSAFSYENEASVADGVARAVDEGAVLADLAGQPGWLAHAHVEGQWLGVGLAGRADPQAQPQPLPLGRGHRARLGVGADHRPRAQLRPPPRGVHVVGPGLVPVVLQLPAADARQASAQLVPRVRPERLDAGGEVADDRSHAHGLDDHPVAPEDRAPP